MKRMTRYLSALMLLLALSTALPAAATLRIPTYDQRVKTSDSVSVRNAKVISWYTWGDGMNIFASNHVSYDHIFCRTSDDCSTIYCTRLGYHGSCTAIRVHDAVYWADVAHPIMICLQTLPQHYRKHYRKRGGVWKSRSLLEVRKSRSPVITIS